MANPTSYGVNNIVMASSCGPAESWKPVYNYKALTGNKVAFYNPNKNQYLHAKMDLI